MRATWLGALAVVTGLALLTPVAVAQREGEGQQQLKQIRLTEQKIKSLIAAQKQMAPLASKLDAAGDKPDAALQTQLEQIAKNNGFATLDELDDVTANVSVVLAGLDPQTGQFTEPPEQIKKDIEELKQDKQMPQKDKDQALADMQEALKNAAPLQFKENVALVQKYRKELDQVLQQEPGQEPSKK